MEDVAINFPITVLGLIGIWNRTVANSWFTPACFFTMLWFMILLITRIIAPEFPAYSFGLWYIVALALALTLGSLLVPIQIVPRQERYSTLEEINFFFYRRSPAIMLLISVFSLTAILGILGLLLFGIRRYELNADLFSVLSLPGQLYDDRDAGIILIPWYIRYLTYFLMPAALLGGIITPFEKLPRKLICYLPIILSVVVGMIYTTRAGILLTLILYLSGLFSSYVLLKKDADLLSDLKTFLGLSFTVLFLISVWLFLQWLRGGASADFIFYPVLNTIKSAVFGTTAAFTTWLQHFHQHGAAFGLYTFAGPLDLIGVNERQLGFYADFITLPTGYTNIYTAFRGLIQDFTIPGSIFICLLIGFLIQLAYLRCRDGNIIWVLPLSLFYAFTLFSPFISIFTSNSVTTAWLFALVVLAFHKKKNAISYSRDTIYNR